MVELFPLENHTALCSPRRVLRYVLVWCASGEAFLQIDENQYVVRANEVVTITSGQVHFLQKSAQHSGWVLEFSFDFFCKDDTDIELIFHNGLFCHFAQNEVIPMPDHHMIASLFARIKAEIEQKDWQYGIAVHAQIELLLVAINRSKIARGDEIWKPDALFLRFLEAVRANFRYSLPLAFFAEKLNATESKLTELAKRFTGKTAQQVIVGLTVSEAKRLLAYESLSVKEVAASLGFDDPFYFSHFFKKQAGVSPKEYREKVR